MNAASAKRPPLQSILRRFAIMMVVVQQAASGSPQSGRLDKVGLGSRRLVATDGMYEAQLAGHGNGLGAVAGAELGHGILHVEARCGG